MALIVTRQADRAEARRVERRAQAGELRRLYAGIYTDDLTAPLETVARRELFSLCALLAPGAIVSHRSAIDLRPTSAGDLFLTGPYRRDLLNVHGLSLRVIRGPGPLPDDVTIPTPFGTTYRSSDARALLENLTRSAGDAATRRTLGQAAVEAWLERLLAREGEEPLNKLRDRARDASERLGLQAAFRRLDVTIGALLGTRKATFAAPAAAARGRGRPYDEPRVRLFDRVLEQLAANPPAIPPVGPALDPSLQAFIESYFSNYIEGTEFALEEAHEIVVHGKPLVYREDDSHDVLGTYQAILDSVAAPRFPQNGAEFLEQLRAWNRRVIQSRAAKRPGEIKAEPNRAGNTVFVAPELVPGTLEQGFTRVMAAGTPEARSAMAMFVVAEVHPFADGNGRTARLAMNLALSAGARTRIVVPTVYREDYLLSLKALSNNGDTTPYVRMLTRAAEFSRWLRYDSVEATFAQLHASNALKRPSEARLELPAPAQRGRVEVPR